MCQGLVGKTEITHVRHLDRFCLIFYCSSCGLIGFNNSTILSNKLSERVSHLVGKT